MQRGNGCEHGFEGGTSLSKAFGLIERFSEDIDINIVVPIHSRGQDDRLLKRFGSAAEESMGAHATVDSRTATRCVKAYGRRLPRAVAVGPPSIPRQPLRLAKVKVQIPRLSVIV